jgi:small-conductance mechanosensitive channel
MKWLEMEIAGSEAWRWLVASGVMLLSVLVMRAVIALAHRRVRNVAERTGTRIDDVIVGTFEQTKWFFYLGVGAYLGTRVLALPPEYERAVTAAATLLFFVQIGIWSNRAIGLYAGVWRTKHEVQGGQATVASGIAFIAQLAVWTIVVLMALSNMGVQITALVAGLGMGGIAAALAVQSILGDLFAALSIYFDRPFVIGDFIEVGEDKGHVERIGLRSTRLRGVDGEQLVFSNRDLTSNRIKNYRRLEERRVRTTIGLDSDDARSEHVERAVQILRNVVEEAEEVRFERAHFTKFRGDALELELVYWVLAKGYGVAMDRQHAVNLAILRRFEEEAIPMATASHKVSLRAEERAEPGEIVDLEARH